MDSKEFIKFTVAGKDCLRYGKYVPKNGNVNKFIFEHLLKHNMICENESITIYKHENEFLVNVMKMKNENESKEKVKPAIYTYKEALELENDYLRQKIPFAIKSLNEFLDDSLGKENNSIKLTTENIPLMQIVHSGGGLKAEIFGLGVISKLIEHHLYGAFEFESGISGGAWCICSLINEIFYGVEEIDNFEKIKNNIKERLIKMSENLNEILSSSESIHVHFTELLQRELIKRETSLEEYRWEILIKKRIPIPILILEGKWEDGDETTKGLIEMTPISTNFDHNQMAIHTKNMGNVYENGKIVSESKKITVEKIMEMCGCAFCVSSSEIKNLEHVFSGVLKFFISLMPSDLKDFAIISPPNVPNPFKETSSEGKEVILRAEKLNIVDYGVVSNSSCIPALKRNCRVILMVVVSEKKRHFSQIISNIKTEVEKYSNEYAYSFPESFFEITLDKLHYTSREGFMFRDEVKDGGKPPALVIIHNNFEGLKKSIDFTILKMNYTADEFDNLFNLGADKVEKTYKMVASEIKQLID